MWSSLQALREALVAPVSSVPLARFRVVFGVLMMVLVGRYLTHDWIREYYVEPKIFFTYPGLGWVHPLVSPWVYVHWIVLGGLALLITLGVAQRVAAGLFCVGFILAHFSDKTGYLNHYYLVALLSGLLAVIPASGVLSIDAWRNPALRHETTPAWCLWSFRFQIMVVYFFGGIGKLNSDWLIHAEPLRIWLSSMSGTPVVGRFLALSITAHLMSWAGALFDLSVPFALCFRRTRWVAFVALIAFHLMTAVLFQIGMFPWIMMASALTLWSDGFAWPHPASHAPAEAADGAPTENALQDFAVAALSSRAGEGEQKKGSQGETPGIGHETLLLAVTTQPFLSRRRLAPLFGLCARVAGGEALLLSYVVVQLLIPLRSLLYPGNTNWTEEGFRFSWKVMLIEKSGSVEFHVTDRASGRSWEVEPRALFTPFQVKMLSTQPDMILQAAHFIADDARAHGIADVEVRADALVSFNGRPAQRIVDPAVDLSRVEDGILPARWILPLADTNGSTR